MPKKSRKRLTGEQARERILDAALERLRVVGPQGLKLTEISAELGVSHQAILHHFGSRDGLVAAVVKRASDALHAEIAGGLRVFGDHERGTGVLIDRSFEVMVDQGHGRLFAWLALAYPNDPRFHDVGQPLAALVELAHALREQESKRAEKKDTAFMFLLLTEVILAASVFEPALLRASGLPDDADTRSEYRRWLRDLVRRHLESR